MFVVVSLRMYKGTKILVDSYISNEYYFSRGRSAVASTLWERTLLSLGLLSIQHWALHGSTVAVIAMGIMSVLDSASPVFAIIQ